MSLQQSNNQSRPVHTCILAMLPAEVIYEVIDAFRRNPYDPDDPRAGLDSLDQTSPRLRSLSLVRPVFFRASNFKQLFQSLRVANATMMDRCEYCDAAPIYKLWPRPHVVPLEFMELLLGGVHEVSSRCDNRLGARARDKISNGLKWLFERGTDGETTNRSWARSSESFDHMSKNLLARLRRGSSKRGMETIFKTMKMLSIHGYPVPTRDDTFPGQVIPDADEWRHDSKRSYRTSSPLSIALKSHVTPSILELMLSEHADRGIKLTDWYDECPTSLVKLATQEDTWGVSVNWTEVSYVDRLIGILHADLHKKWTGWEEEYFGEAADIFQAKLKLMIKYEMIDTSEEALLKSIGSALYSIAADGMQAGGYDQEHIKRSWEKLCDAVKPFATDANLVEDPNGIQLPNAPRRIHRFAIHPEWNPWESWFRRQDEIRREEWKDMRSWHATTKRFKPMQYDRATSLGVPEWHTVSMDEWDAFFPRPE
ncbi:unnamed protein product [Fusarium graminearum]|uniref:Uncharacterized protein n=1 Tax=Gibberella zeae TaxID=5518 RepID=A0A9N8R8X5_GIBZA|nr:unnamed protein product [Fusarium graminearum]CAG1978701.1 unnamed protein product [Fusarium graminearum]